MMQQPPGRQIAGPSITATGPTDQISGNAADASLSRFPWALLVGVLVMVVMRLWLMATLPLADTTEARYAELSRVTAEGGFWLMPHITPTEPFFAKPPLSFWASALAWKWLGESEFFLRLPSFLTTLLTACLLAWFWRREGGSRKGAWLIALVMASSPLMFISAGSVMTDAIQMAIITAAMLLARLAIQEPDQGRWRILFWTTLGIATLSKGLATLVLTGLPLAAFALVTRQWRPLVRNLWSFPGLLLAAAITLAWYVPAEIHYPGFLHYFLIGEHFQRFLEPGWQGDRYGNAHHQALGMIWAYWTVAIGAWLPAFFLAGHRDWKEFRRSGNSDDLWLWCWVLTPLLFFTFSSNIIWTYAITAIPPLALVIARWAETVGPRIRIMLLGLLLIQATALGVVGALRQSEAREPNYSARQMVETAHRVRPGSPLFVHYLYPFSASFYTAGHAQRLKDLSEIDTHLAPSGLLLLLPTDSVAGLEKRYRVETFASNPTAALVELKPGTNEKTP